MSEYDEERTALIARMNTLSNSIRYNVEYIKSNRREIEQWQEDNKVRTSENVNYELELQNIIRQLKEEYQD